MTSVLTSAQIEALRQLDASTVANAIETFRRRLRNEGFVDPTVRSMFPHLKPMVGFATTLKIRGSAPPLANGAYPDRTDWWDHILAVPEPRVVVIQDLATRPGLGSLVGAVHMNILKALRCVGVVTNGSVRDLPAAESAGFHLFAASVAVSHAYVHVIEFGEPVEIGGLKIQSGDLLHGDLHGVQSIPLDLAPLIPPVAAEILAKEQKFIALCQSPDFTLEKLRVALADERILKAEHLPSR